MNGWSNITIKQCLICKKNDTKKVSYRLLDGRLVEDANDEKLTKRFGSTYTFFKKQHPSLHKLPENEVSDICYTFNKSPYGDTPEKAVARTNDYIKSQMPRWEKEYFNPMPATPKPMSTSANVSANANTAASWGNFGTPNKNNMFTTSSGKSLKQNSWETLGGTKDESLNSFTPMKMPKPAPEPKVPQMTPMLQMPQMQTPTPWATGQTSFVKPKIKTMAERQEKLYNNPQAENNYYLMPMTNKYQSYPKLNPYLCAGNQFLQGLSLGWSDELNGASAALYNAMNETIPDLNSFRTMAQNYTQNRDNLRQFLAACEKQYPKTLNASKRFGNILTSIAMKSSPIGAFAPLLIPYIKYMGEK